jgi:ABC-type phosphate/phosphonate transport system substrate-binding protein
MMLRPVFFILALVVFAIPTWQASSWAGENEASRLSLVVMDPLAAPLSCPCVEGYAQRDYQALVNHLQHELGCQVTLAFAESLEKAREKASDQVAHLVIGKDSVVRADAKRQRLEMSAVASLTGKDGKTTQRGLIVVGAKDRAERVEDLQGYRIFLGPLDSLEKHGAAKDLLAKHEVRISDNTEVSEACSDGACRILELGPEAKVAAVISSYAQPLLEGCGTVEKGALRVVGTTRDVPFITAFVAAELPEPERQRITDALLTVAAKPDVCQALESLLGFVPYAREPADDAAAAKKN